jgi:hypothetical protein
MLPLEAVQAFRSGVMKINLEREGNVIASGTGFLIADGFATNSHVIRGGGIQYDRIALLCDGLNPGSPDNYIRIEANVLGELIAAESAEGGVDYAMLEFEDDRFAGRHRFELCAEAQPLVVGEQVLFMGFPFGMTFMTAHVGYVSSLYNSGAADVIQIDGSINSGNSGGPLIDLNTGHVAGLITKAYTGLIEAEFNELLNAFRQNIQVLQSSSQGGSVRLMGINPLEALMQTQVAMQRIAINLKRSANVGIGYAYSSRHLRETLDVE